MSKKYLFICGCPRSGTTALWRLLVSDPRIILGVERYGNKFFSKEGLEPNDFVASRFFNVQQGDTFYDDLVKFNPYYNEAQQRFQNAIYIGDKIPLLYRYFADIKSKFPDAKILFLFRNVFDVAASYKVRAMDENDTSWSRDRDVGSAIDDWNASIKFYREYKDRLDIFPVDYERLYEDETIIHEIFNFLGVSMMPAIIDIFRGQIRRANQLEAGRARALTQAEVKDICMRASFGGYRAIFGNT